MHWSFAIRAEWKSAGILDRRSIRKRYQGCEGISRTQAAANLPTLRTLME
jgi:hypothetical protein